MTRRKKSCTDCEFCNDAEPVDGLRYFCDKKNIYFDPYKTITCRLFRQVSSSVLRIRARWAAMQLAKKKAAEEKSKKESAVKGKNGLLKKDTISNDSEKNASQIIIH